MLIHQFLIFHLIIKNKNSNNTQRYRVYMKGVNSLFIYTRQHNKNNIDNNNICKNYNGVW